MNPLDVVRPLIRTRQVYEFTAEPVSEADLFAITEVARWTGSSRNEQPWRFLVVRDESTLRRIHEAGLPQTRAFATAPVGIAIVLPADPGRIAGGMYDEGRAAERILIAANMYDEGRAAERMLIAANMLGLGAAITWIRPEQAVAREILGLPADRRLTTLLAVGHPTEAAKLPKADPGTARLPRVATVFEDGWPDRTV